jgi:L-idonate 5-dehydrogenase
MRAVVLHGKKDLRIETVAEPEVGPTQVAVSIRNGGICGSDLHYFQHGANGTIVVKQPMVLGHEIAGVVAAVGSEVRNVAVGDKVAVHPSAPCGHCPACLGGLSRHCRNMRFLGSAMHFPHTQGGFSEVLVCAASQAYPLPPAMDLAVAAFAEPLAVCMHAVSRAGPVAGRRVLVTGAGPIGLLVAMLLKHGGAAEILVTDVADPPLRIAAKVAASRVINVSAEPEALRKLVAEAGGFDIAFECSGHVTGVTASIKAVRACGILMQVGMLGPEVSAPLGEVVVREIDYRGTFRFDREFGEAVDLLVGGSLDVRALLTQQLPFDAANEAFVLAADRSQAMKVQLVFA